MLTWFAKKDNGRSSETKDLPYEDVKERIVSLIRFMGEKACGALYDSLKALGEGDLDLAKKVVEGDEVIDSTEVDVNNECLSSMAMRCPVREDLRFVFAVLKIATDLERLGDQAVNIAQSSLAMNGFRESRFMGEVFKMGETAVSMVERALKAFYDCDSGLALKVYEEDESLDAVAADLSDKLVTVMSETSKNREKVLAEAELFLTARHLERVGDHACNISERVFFMVRGERLKDVLFGKKNPNHRLTTPPPR